MRIFTLCFITIFCLLLSQNCSAQKFGYLNSNEILTAHPKVKMANTKLSIYHEQWQSKINQKYEEANILYKAIVDCINNPTCTESLKVNKEKEMQLKIKDAEDIEKKAKVAIQEKQNELLSPVLEEIQHAIDRVAEMDSYDFIVDTSTGVFLYTKKGFDITNEVLKELGI